MRRSAAAALTALLALGSLVSPATAYHDETTPLLDWDQFSRAHWVSYQFSTDGSKVVADFEVHDVARPIQVGYAVYDAQNRGIFRFTYNSVEATSGVYVDATAGGENIHVDLTQPTSRVPHVRLALTFNGPDSEPKAGTYKLLMWSAGKGLRHYHALRGGTGVTCAGVAHGFDTFIYSAKDFDGTATVSAGGNAGIAGITGGTGARANYETSRKVHTDGTLVGVFLSLASAVDELTVDTPSGTQDCPCLFGNFVADGESKPLGVGPYTFRGTGAGVAGAEGDFLLAAADARLVGFDVAGSPCVA